ncbi:hypothetical protein GGI20_005978 [Coemansia sp. BCRC 34301]|nr:hypothetical protein GGI20_005978 [Coemansia sp. BCRC 34301]
MHHMASELIIELFGTDICFGNALKMLSFAPYDGCAFPMRIKEAAPMLREINIQPCTVDDSVILPGRLLRDTVSRGFQLASRSKYDGYEEHRMLTGSLQSSTSNLVHLDCMSKLDSESAAGLNLSESLIIELVRRNAQSLQPLFIRRIDPDDICALINGPDDSYTTYPNLHTLKLSQPGHEHTPHLAVSNGIALFPHLRYLEVGSYYPFVDDPLF